MSDRSYSDCVSDILAAIDYIETDTADHDSDSFRADRKATQLVKFNMGIISEASRRLPDSLKAQESGIPWGKIAGIGNVLQHDYGNVSSFSGADDENDAKVKSGDAAARSLMQSRERLGREAMERALLRMLRKRIGRGGTLRLLFRYANMLQGKMSALNVRDTDSIRQQEYSTPLHMAFAAQAAARVWDASSVLEPSAGNGALITGARPNAVRAMEISAGRARTLERAGYDVSCKSSLEPENYTEQEFDVIIANPPFGAQETVPGSGQNREWPVDEDTKPTFTTQRDYAMAALALRWLNRKRGRAVLILSSLPPAEQGKPEEERRNKYAGNENRRVFFNHLHDHYKVAAHYTAPGNLYAKQGAGWPVDIVVIDQQAASSVPRPWDRAPEQLKENDDLLQLFDPAEMLPPEAAREVLDSVERQRAETAHLQAEVLTRPRIRMRTRPGEGEQEGDEAEPLPQAPMAEPVDLTDQEPQLAAAAAPTGDYDIPANVFWNTFRKDLPQLKAAALRMQRQLRQS